MVCLCIDEYTEICGEREQKYLEATGDSIGNLIVAGLGRERRIQRHVWSMLCLGERSASQSAA